MEKLVYLVHARRSVDGAELRSRVVDHVVPAVHAGGGDMVSVHLDDDAVTIPGPLPFGDGELPVRAVVSFWMPCHDDRHDAEALVSRIGERCDGYLVTESVYSDFGQRRGEPRSWPPGDRSPGVVTVALVHRNPLLDGRTFRELWYGHQSPMSERVQPRMRYVRNSVAHPLTAGAPPLDGIVVESWESEEVVADIEAFHLGDLENLTVMMDSVGTAFDMSRLRSVAMSEYLF